MHCVHGPTQDWKWSRVHICLSHLVWLAIALQPMFLGCLRAERHRERWWVLSGGGNRKPILSFFLNTSICLAFTVDSLLSLRRRNLIKHVQIFGIGDMHLAKDPGGPGRTCYCCCIACTLIAWTVGRASLTSSNTTPTICKPHVGQSTWVWLR